jgi:hypothetical protein
MYRDFVYMDMGRIQSIIAQLQQGVLEKMMEGKTSELQGKAGIAAGVLASFLPVELGESFTRKRDVQSSKILHDYAFNMALDSLNENDLCLEVEEWDRKELPLPDTAFVLARGSMSILDYALLKNLAENECSLDRLFGDSRKSQQHSGQKRYSQRKSSKSESIQQIWTLVDAFMGDSLQVRLISSGDIVFVGTLSREFLRESTRDLIFKYGGKPQKGWSMLAQVCQVTEPSNKLGTLSQLMQDFSGLPEQAIGSTTDVINPIVELLNAFQEAMASVSYPAIAVTPIALYRELESLR